MLSRSSFVRELAKLGANCKDRGAKEVTTQVLRAALRNLRRSTYASSTNFDSSDVSFMFSSLVLISKWAGIIMSETAPVKAIRIHT
jgi:hypothetical protein